MKYFYDTEFIESGYGKPLQLISIGIVNEEGWGYYAVSNEFNPNDANEWVKENVLTRLDIPQEGAKSIDQIRKDILCFTDESEEIELWGYYCAYDHVMLSMIFGRMIDLPEKFPMYTKDLKQLCDMLGNPPLPEQKSAEHDALADARWNKTVYGFLINRI